MARDYSPILVSILSTAAGALRESGAPTARNVITPGVEPAWDECCDGMLYLRVIDVFPTVGFRQTAPFPAMDTAQLGVGCSINMLGLHLGLGVLRCAANIDDHKEFPDPAQISADGLEMVADMAVLLDVLECGLKGHVAGIQQLKIDRWTPRGPQGNCHGGEWPFYLAVDPCIPCAQG